MDPRTEAGTITMDSVESFYDRLAPDYDAMTTFEKRFIQEEPFFRLLVQRYRIASALDAGSGTGFHSILLARLGVSVTAVDISSRMIAELSRHTAQLGVNIRTVQSRFAELPSRVSGPFDAIFCMGNSLAHLLSTKETGEALRAFARLLPPDGILFTQVLNYDRILLTRPQVQSVKETPQGVFTRSYEYLGDTIRFSITKRPIDGGPGEEHVQSVELRPVISREYLNLLKEAGFDEVRAFGSVAMERFDPVESRDLVVLARRADVV
jgi:glycine/sarcosine N-methyltransferase